MQPRSTYSHRPTFCPTKSGENARHILLPHQESPGEVQSHVTSPHPSSCQEQGSVGPLASAMRATARRKTAVWDRLAYGLQRGRGSRASSSRGAQSWVPLLRDLTPEQQQRVHAEMERLRVLYGLSTQVRWGGPGSWALPLGDLTSSSRTHDPPLHGCTRSA